MEGSIDINYIFWLGTSVMLILAFALIFLVLFYQNYLGKLKQKEAELLLKTALVSEKNERQRIASDLHDSVQGDLNALKNYLTILERESSETSIVELLTHAKKSLDTAITNTHVISNKLMPPLLATSGFSFALRDYLEQLSLLTEKKFVFTTDLVEVSIPTNYSYELFRIVEEFCQNMLKHGEINEAFIVLYNTTEGLCLDIIDDGKPFKFQTSYSESMGSGLRNIQSRIKSIHATLTQREVTVGNHFVIQLKESL